MLADPTVVTINGVAKSLVRVNQDAYSSVYSLREATGDYRMNVRNTSKTDKSSGRVTERHNVELIHTIYPVAPSTLSTVRKVYFVIENQQGDTLTDPLNEALALCALLTATSGAMITKMLNSES